MVLSLFSKMLTVMMLFMTVIQMISAQYIEEGDLPESPNKYLVYYKDCKGALQQCANCLGSAERNCEEAAKKNGASPFTCSQCTSSVNGNCDGIKRMCFGNQECGPNHKCIDFECEYQL